MWPVTSRLVALVDRFAWVPDRPKTPTPIFPHARFDPIEQQPLVTSIGPADVDSAASRELAQRVAAEGLVLLKNTAGFLPMDGAGGRRDASKTKFAFIGPAANFTQDLLSGPQYHGTNRLVNSHSPLQVAVRLGWDVTYAKGCNICDWVPPGFPNMPCSIGVRRPRHHLGPHCFSRLHQHRYRRAELCGLQSAARYAVLTGVRSAFSLLRSTRGPLQADGKSGPLPPPDVTMIPFAVAAAKAADVAVLFLGADQTTEAENFDRRELGLVGAQEQLLDAVLAVNKNVVVVLIHGGPIDVSSAAASDAVQAIVDAFQPGELGSDAIMVCPFVI